MSGGKLARSLARDVGVTLAPCDTLAFTREGKAAIITSSNANHLRTAIQVLHRIYSKHIDKAVSFLLYSWCVHEVIETQCVGQAVLVESKGVFVSSQNPNGSLTECTSRAISPSLFL